MISRTLASRGIALGMSLIFGIWALDAQERRSETVEATLEPTGAASIRFTLTNLGDQPVTVLKWHTPLEGIQNDIFRIVHEGKPVPYVGRLVSRGLPTGEEFIRLNPSESASTVVDLGKAYAFPEPGRYEVWYDPKLEDRLPADRAAGAGITAAEIRAEKPVFIEQAELTKPKVPEHPVAAAAPEPTYIDCSDDQKSKLKQALPDAEKISLAALNKLNNTPGPNNEDYKTWFGAYEEARYKKVTNNFTAIHSALSTKAMTFYCKGECEAPSWIAYVWKGAPYGIYFCERFWDLNGPKYRPGTLVHEVSHFYVVANTEDYAYSPPACKQLAQNSPDKAIGNADSYEFLAEPPPASGGLEHLSALFVIFAAILAERLLRRRRA